jgi:dihydroflavonol-4-reductase
MRILVTGSSGFIGSVVLRKLLAQGHTVRCLVRRTSNTVRIDNLESERTEGDIRDQSSVREAILNCDAVIHLACIANWSDIHSTEMHDVVVGGTKNILAAAQTAGCSRVVYVSSSLAINGSDSPRLFDETSRHEKIAGLGYARAKLEAEDLCRDAARGGLNVVIVNPGEVYGPNDTGLVTAGNLIDFAKSFPVFVCRGGTAIVYIDDVADGIIAALTRGRTGERYILSGENVSVRQIAETTLEILGQKKRIVLLPNWLVRGVAWAGRTFRIPLPFNPAVVPYATLYWFMNNSKARDELGMEFRSARETLRPTLFWLRELGYIK